MGTDLTKGDIMTHVRQIAIPASVGLFFNTLYNVVDTFYAGRLSTDALAGMTISFPIFFIVIALSTGVGSGTTALSAISLGEKDVNNFHKLGINAIITSIVISLLVFIGAPFLTEFLFELSGAIGQAKILGIDYTNMIFMGALFFVLNSTINGMLNATGDTKSYRNFLIIGFFMNLILDPLFIFGWFGLPELGTAGVALATVVVQAVGTMYLSYCLINNAVFELKIFKKSSLSFKTVGQILKQGIPSSLNMATIAIGVFVINYFVLLYASGASTIAAYGAAMRLEQMTLLPALGLNIAALTITGQNFGAGLYERIYEVQRKTIIVGGLMMVVGGIIIFIFTPFLISIFNNDPLVIEAGTSYLRIEVFALPTYIILNILISVLQGVKKPTFAVYVGLYRQILLPFILFPLFGGLYGINGVWYSIVFINWSALFFTYVYSKVTLKKVFN